MKWADNEGSVDVYLDGRPATIDRLSDIKWLRTAQFMAGINLAPTCNLDKKERVLKAARHMHNQAKLKAWSDKRGRAYTESAHPA